MIDTKQFIRELKTYGVMWCENERQHLIANEPLTNLDMKIMCSNRFGEEYNKLNNTQKKRVRESIFRGIRYGD